MKRLRIGVKGLLRVTFVARDVNESFYVRVVEFFRDQLKLTDGQRVGAGFKFFLTWT